MCFMKVRFFYGYDLSLGKLGIGILKEVGLGIFFGYERRAWVKFSCFRLFLNVFFLGSLRVYSYGFWVYSVIGLLGKLMKI